MTPRHQRTSVLPRFLFGVPYYPEHDTRADAQHDARRMLDAGVNVVRMAEFGWDRMEARPGEFDFSLFEQTIAHLGEHDIDTILCTPTAAPPRWLSAQNENWLRVDADGRRMKHGSRQHLCTTNSGFRAESERITHAMAEHFAANPHVIGWQTDNEFHCHFSECFCAACVVAFRIWLRQKYGDIHALNASWGAAFWAQTYDNFEQVELPHPHRPTHPNPHAQLDYFRFLSDMTCDFQRGQVEVLRAANAKWWITHNGLFDHLNYWKLTDDLDLLGVDIYPGFEPNQPRGYAWASLKNEEARAASGTYIVPEQQGGAGGQQPYLHETPPPGQMRLWAYQSIAHGADGILHFRWRSCRFGAEEYWNGILDHDNIPRRRYAEFAQEGAELKRIGAKILGTALLIRAAVLIDTDQDEAHSTLHLGLPGPEEQRKILYHEMMVRHLPAGLVNAADSFDGLELIIVPSFVVMDETLAQKLRDFTAKGGVLVATARTATRDGHNHVFSHTPLGLLGDVFGVSVEEFGKLNQTHLTMMAGETRIDAGPGYEILEPHGAKILAIWNAPDGGSPHAGIGKAALTSHAYGLGTAIYIGTYFSESNVPLLFDLLLKKSPLEALAGAAEYVEITCRHNAQRRLFFVLNHDSTPQIVTGLPRGNELISGQGCNGRWSLEPYGVAVIEQQSA